MAPRFSGRYRLPIEIHKYTVNRSTFVHKDAREQFEIRVHKRLLDIVNPTPKVIDSLAQSDIAGGSGYRDKDVIVLMCFTDSV